MADEVRKSNPFDEYADQFTVTINPFGASLSFAVQDPHPPEKGQPAQSHQIGTIRMSVEHLKTMVMLLWSQVRQLERSTKVKVEVPHEVLNEFNISPQDWETLWNLK